VKRAALALAVLTAATIALAQQTTPPSSADPRTSPAPQEQPAPPADSNAGISQADKQALMNKCLTQVQAANPNVPEKDVRAYCDKEINSIASPR
jgi:hypothetical protein